MPSETACTRCGLPGEQHADEDACIDALRDQIGTLGLIEEARREKAGVRLGGAAGGWRNRKDQRFVILDGRRMCLADAARELGLNAATLHSRIVVRAGPDYRDVDVRVIGADRRLPQAGGRSRRAATAPGGGNFTRAIG